MCKQSLNHNKHFLYLLAAIHIGLGEHQLNAFLSILNMPTVSHKMFDQRSKEVGEVLESLAEESMVEWTEKEKTLTKECVHVIIDLYKNKMNYFINY